LGGLVEVTGAPWTAPATQKLFARSANEPEPARLLDGATDRVLALVRTILEVAAVKQKTLVKRSSGLNLLRQSCKDRYPLSSGRSGQNAGRDQGGFVPESLLEDADQILSNTADIIERFHAAHASVMVDRRAI
jgi:hypothetical protein